MKAGPLLFLCVLVALLLASCVPAVPPQGAPAQAVAQPTSQVVAQPTAQAAASQRGGTLTVALAEQPSTLNPYGGMSDQKTILHIMETLVGLNLKTLEPEPLLATSWQTPDDKTYVFTLRKGVKFHDGTDFNAQAVKADFDYMLDDKNASPRKSDFDRIQSVEAQGDDTVIFRLKEPFSVFLSTLATRGYIVSPTQLKNAKPEELDAKPIGTGPFRVVEWVKDDRIVLERFPGYWDPNLPYLDKLVYKILPDQTSKMVAFKAGEVDMVDNVPATDIDTIKKDDRFVYASVPSPSYRSIYLNCAAPPFNDVRLRQALAWAVDRDELIRLGALGIGIPAYGPLAPAQWAFDPNFKPYKRDLNQVKELLAGAGVPSGFSFTLKVANDPQEIRVAEVLQQQFASAGIKMDMITGEYTALRSTVIAGDYQAFYVGWLGEADPDANMWNSFHEKGWFNWVRYKNPKVNDLLDKARTVSEIKQRRDLYLQAQQIISDEAPMVFLKFPYFAADGQAYSKRVQDFVPDPMQEMHFRSVWVQTK